MILGAFLYISAHFVFYLLFLKNKKSFAREGTILRFHFLSFLLSLGLLFVYRLCAQESVGVPLVLFGSMHGIYSLSFLEIWGLSDGGFSVRILNRISKASENNANVNLDEIEALGDLKVQDRWESLRERGFIESRGERYVHRPLGRVTAMFISSVMWLANMKKV